MGFFQKKVVVYQPDYTVQCLDKYQQSNYKVGLSQRG